eukprot:113004-Pelagomonas_calceolata.AAC.8
MGWGKWRWGSLLAWMGRKGSGIGASALECAAWWLAVRGGGLPKVWPGGRGRSWGATVADAACPEGVHAWTGGGPCSCWRGRGCKLWGWEAWACAAAESGIHATAAAAAVAPVDGTGGAENPVAAAAAAAAAAVVDGEHGDLVGLADPLSAAQLHQ